METWRNIGLVALVVALLLVVGSRGFIRPVVHTDGVPTIEVAVFQGALGLDWHQSIARKYEHLRAQENRPVRINLWGDPRVHDKIKPRILQRCPPEASLSPLPFWRLLAAGLLVPFDPWLDAPAYDTPDNTWRDTFLPGALDAQTYRGQVFGVPMVYNANFIWYDKKLFRDHGWQPPSTWNEWMVLCDEIKNAGIAPIAYQGKYVAYGTFIFWPIVERCGGIPLIERINAGQPTAFLAPQFVRASQLFQDVAQQQFQRGAMSMTHTEAQMEFCKREAAMVACGLWLEAEMRRNWLPDFELACFPVPPIENGQGTPGALYAGIGEVILLFADAHNHDDTGEFLKFMLSRENLQELSREKSMITAIQGSTLREALSPALAAAYDLIGEASITYSVRINELFPTWHTQVFVPNFEMLIRAQLTPEQFAQNLASGLESSLEDPRIFKPPVLETDL